MRRKEVDRPLHGRCLVVAALCQRRKLKCRRLQVGILFFDRMNTMLVTEAEAKELADLAKKLRRAVIAWLNEKHPKLANT